MITQMMAIPSPLRANMDQEAFDAGKAVELSVDLTPCRFDTPSGRVEILNPALEPHLPVYRAPHGGNGALCLITAPSLYALNSSFYERDDLRRKQRGMRLVMNPVDARSRGLADGQRVIAFNGLGEVEFLLKCSSGVPVGVVVAEGVWWLEFTPGERSVNALTSQRLTDRGRGSTFCDNRVEVRSAVPD